MLREELRSQIGAGESGLLDPDPDLDPCGPNETIEFLKVTLHCLDEVKEFMCLLDNTLAKKKKNKLIP